MKKNNHSDSKKSIESNTEEKSSLSRRGFIKTVGSGVIATVAANSIVISPDKSRAESDSTQSIPGAKLIQTKLKINGKKYTLNLEPRWTLLDTLRDQLNLSGTKKGCDHGDCGACTVIKDGKPVLSCMTLTTDCQNSEIITIEGLANGSQLHPLQKAFIDYDGLMCGFCTPGFIMVLKSYLDKNPNPSIQDIQKSISGNLCRCAAYPKIFESALAAAKQMKNK